MIEGVPPIDGKPPSTLERLEAHAKTLPFEGRQELMQAMVDLQKKLKMQLGRCKDGFEMIDGKRIFIEASEQQDGYIIRGLEWLSESPKIGFVSSPRHPTKEAAMAIIQQVARENGYTIVE